MLVQPYVENAIKHGLSHKQGDKKLIVTFAAGEERTLQVTIEDNGIGREASVIINQARHFFSSINGYENNRSKIAVTKRLCTATGRNFRFERGKGRGGGYPCNDLHTFRRLTMIQAIIIDNEKKCISLLQQLLQKSFSRGAGSSHRYQPGRRHPVDSPTRAVPAIYRYRNAEQEWLSGGRSHAGRAVRCYLHYRLSAVRHQRHSFCCTGLSIKTD